MFPILGPLRRTTLTFCFCGEYGAKWRQRTDSVCGRPNLSVYVTVIQSLLIAKPEGHIVIHVWSIIAPTMWPGRKMSWKWWECESDIAQGCTRKSIRVGSLRDDSPGTTSNPDGMLSTGMSSGRGVAGRFVEVGAVTPWVICRGGPCWRPTQVYWLFPSLEKQVSHLSNRLKMYAYSSHNSCASRVTLTVENTTWNVLRIRLWILAVPMWPRHGLFLAQTVTSFPTAGCWASL